MPSNPCNKHTSLDEFCAVSNREALSPLLSKTKHCDLSVTYAQAHARRYIRIAAEAETQSETYKRLFYLYCRNPTVRGQKKCELFERKIRDGARFPP